ncbi:MAG: DegT/DnrJ/EryC1/StrS family aminotransferase [Treponemataceae bacterium]
MHDFVPFSMPSTGTEEEKAVCEVLRSGWLTTAQVTLSFEKEFARFVKSNFALAVNSATSGLMLAYNACGVTQGTKILTTPCTFTSTANAARHLGGEIEYADVEKNTFSIDVNQIEEKLKKDTNKQIKVIVPVHIAGNLCNMEEINSLAKKYEVHVVEDAAHAFPSPTKNGFAGTLGSIGVYSFYATKTITTAEGGMICTNNEAFAKQMEVMRLHGIDRSVWNRYTSNKSSWEYDVIADGWKCNLPDILSAIGREQLKKANDFYQKRLKIVEKYNKAFENYDFCSIPPTSEGNAWHLYILRLNLPKLRITRNEFSQKLQENGVGNSVHFIPHFYLTYWKNRYNLSEKAFPCAKKHFESVLSLPLWPDMTEKMISKVIDEVLALGKKYEC